MIEVGFCKTKGGRDARGHCSVPCTLACDVFINWLRRRIEPYTWKWVVDATG